MSKTSHVGGLLSCFSINLVVAIPCCFLGLIFVALHFLVDTPFFLVYLFLGAWILGAVVLTIAAAKNKKKEKHRSPCCKETAASFPAGEEENDKKHIHVNIKIRS